jgi:uracil DNA glycosylase
MLVGDWKNGKLRLESPPKLFDRFEEQAVLLLNTSLTIGVTPSTAQAVHEHFPLWKPFLVRVLSWIASRSGQRAVLLLWGRNANDIVECEGIRDAAERAGTWGTRIAVVRHAHPAAISNKGAVFLVPPNPFLAANRALKKLGSEHIRW